jgi:hypothetical protein
VCPVAKKAIFENRESDQLVARLDNANFGLRLAGWTLGNPKLHVARKGATDAVKAETDRYAANVLPIIREAQKAGARTLGELAGSLSGESGHDDDLADHT